MVARECCRRASVVGVGRGGGIVGEAGEADDVDVSNVNPAARSHSACCVSDLVSDPTPVPVPEETHFRRNCTISSSMSSSQRLSLSPSDARMRISLACTGSVMRWAVVRGVISGGGGGDGECGLEPSRACGEGERGGKKRRDVLERREERVGGGIGGVLDGRGGASCTGVLN